MKKLSSLLSVICLASCGGASDSSDNLDHQFSGEIEACSIVMSVLSIENGTRCELSQADADLFSVSAGVLSCENNILSYEGNTFDSGSEGIVLNMLTIRCVDA